MTQVLERRPGSLPEYDAKGEARARRTFMVDIRPQAIPRDGSLVGLPGRFDPHPDIPGALVRQIIPGVIEGKNDWSVV